MSFKSNASKASSGNAGAASKGAMPKKGGKKLEDSKSAFNLKALQPVVVHKQASDLVTYANGDTFEGAHQGPDTLFLPSGEGRYSMSATGIVYEGIFEDGVLVGQGSVQWQSGDTLTGDFDAGGGCVGVLQYESGEAFEGEVSLGRREGRGVMQYKNGVVFDGAWAADVREGPGRLAWPSGDWVQGEWVAGACPAGTGRHTSADGDVYEGALAVSWAPPSEAAPSMQESLSQESIGSLTSNGSKPSTTTASSSCAPAAGAPGNSAPTETAREARELAVTLSRHGALTGKDGSKYDGHWEQDTRQGNGTQLWADGRSFTGVWRNDEPVKGEGLQRGGAQGDAVRGPWEYQGGLERGRRVGHGVCRWQSGAVYQAQALPASQGEWSSDLQQGKGEMVEANGDTYDGEWMAGKMEGKGHKVWSEGSVYTGAFNQGAPHGRGNALFSNGEAYEGEFSLINQDPWTPGGVPHGLGRLVWQWGDVYQGQMESGRPHGRGKLSNETGEWMEGVFADGAAAGTMKGARFFGDGSTYEGEMSGGWMPHGAGVLRFGDGAAYHGRFADGEPSGYGIFESVTGAPLYEGEFAAGRPAPSGQPTPEAMAAWPLR